VVCQPGVLGEEGAVEISADDVVAVDALDVDAAWLIKRTRK